MKLIEKIKNIPIDIIILGISLCISTFGFLMTIYGAFLNGLEIYSGNNYNLDEGFGLILMGISIIASGLVGVIIAFVVLAFSNIKR